MVVSTNMFKGVNIRDLGVFGANDLT